MRILNICNLWILLRKIVKNLVGQKCHLLFMDFFDVKVDGSEVIAGICKEVFIWFSYKQIPGLTSLLQL